MTFHINRLYCLKTKAFWKHCSKWLLFIAIVIALNLLGNGVVETATIFAILIFTVVYVASYLQRIPNKFTIENDQVLLWMELKKPLPDGVTFNRRHWRWAKLFVTVCKVEQIEYSSDVEEKEGVIRLYGEIRTQTKSGEYVELYQPLEVVELMGVKSFSEAQYQLKKAFPNAEYVRI